ncbi:MAG: methionyl-tRNA formyltransferase, partial [Anaerolineae bacterium]
QLGAELLIEILPAYMDGDLQPRPQPEEGVTVVRRFPKSAAELAWERAAVDLARRVRAFAPQPGAYTTWDGRRLKILQARAVASAEMPDAEPGVTFVWEDMPAVVTGEGALLLLHLQMAGKRPMSGDAFLRGRREFEGAKLGSQ